MERANLKQLESTLFTLATESIKEFARAHKNESFYAFGLDCNAEYGNVLLCLNTEEDFRETSQRYIEKWNYKEPELAGLKRNFGDWKYQGFNLEQLGWNEKWRPFESAIERYFEAEVNDGEDEAFVRMEEFQEELMRAFCRVMVRLEQSGALSQLSRDEGFYTHVQDHDEADDDATQRLADVRDEAAA